MAAVRKARRQGGQPEGEIGDSRGERVPGVDQRVRLNEDGVQSGASVSNRPAGTESLAETRSRMTRKMYAAFLIPAMELFPWRRGLTVRKGFGTGGGFSVGGS